MDQVSKKKRPTRNEVRSQKLNSDTKKEFAENNHAKKNSTSNLNSSSNIKNMKRTSLNAKISISQKRGSISTTAQSKSNLASIQNILEHGEKKEGVSDFIHEESSCSDSDNQSTGLLKIKEEENDCSSQEI